METWKKVEEFPQYEVSDLGRVRMAKGKKEVKGTLSSDGYIAIGRKALASHRLIAKTFIDNPENKPYVDHINGVRNDNRIENLRWATNSENQANRKLVGGSSKYKGVVKVGNSWRARVVKNKTTFSIGRYKTEGEAGRAYDLKALELFGQFAKLNFPLDNYI